MARGKTASDADAAEAARVRLVEEAGRAPVPFEVPEDDPRDEAKPAIRESFADFTARSDAMVAVAEGADVASPEALRASVAAIGRACAACHQPRRE